MGMLRHLQVAMMQVLSTVTSKADIKRTYQEHNAMDIEAKKAKGFMRMHMHYLLPVTKQSFKQNQRKELAKRK